ncbi:TrmH family RNA methyltransferase [Candidatus Falkowbacteria bacterium]|nr:TrmH family RNA methyltransferase [Candidatus Falkowbacteria bacterium]
MVVILHNVRSTHNVGSIFRTADAAGCEKIYLCGITPAPIDRFGRENEKISKVALGAEKWIAWEKFGQTAKLIDKLKKPARNASAIVAGGDGYKILAIEQSRRSIPYQKIKLTKKDSAKIALVVGNEIKGLPPAILRRADKILEIPMRGKKESLNVAVAFGIVAFDLINK